jgi:hypothetical protein
MSAPPVEFERIASLVERVTFLNEQNGFCVLRLKVKGIVRFQICGTGTGFYGWLGADTSP